MDRDCPFEFNRHAPWNGGMMFKLEMIDDMGRTLSFPLKAGKGVISIGRKQDNDIVLPDLSVSRNHALIYINENALSIEDLQSANGVLVNNIRIAEKTPIKDGDEIIIGENRFHLRPETAFKDKAETSGLTTAPSVRKNE